MHAAQVRGLAFTCLSDFTEPQPFWRITNNTGSTSKIISHALTIPDESFKQILLEPNAEVIWISIEEALFVSWINKDERSIWHKMFILTLNNIVSASAAEQERYILKDIFDD